MITYMDDEQRLKRNEYMRAYNAAHPEARKAAASKTYAANRDRILAQQRDYRMANVEHVKAIRRASEDARRVQIQEEKRADYQKHREQRIATVHAYADANPEKIAERKREYQRTHRAEIAERKRAYYAAHRDAQLAKQRESEDRRTYQAAYRNDPTHRAAAYCWWANRRAEAYGLPDRLTPEQVLAIEGPCDYCGGEPTGWDHVVPMAAGGLNTPANLVPACFPCNRHKGRGVLA